MTTKINLQWDEETVDRILAEVKADLISGAITARHFNMQHSLIKKGCGTAACIGGHMILRRAAEMNLLDVIVAKDAEHIDAWGVSELDKIERAHSSPERVKWLFYGRMHEGATPREAAKAIDRFQRGEPYPWR